MRIQRAVDRMVDTMPRSHKTGRVWYLVCGLVLTLVPHPAQSQATADSTTAASVEPAPAHVLIDRVAPSRLIAVSHELRAENTMVAVTFSMPLGSRHDPAGAEGTTWILGEALRTTIQERLSTVPAQVFTEVDRDRMAVTLIAPPDDWESSTNTLIGILTREGPSTTAIDEAMALLNQALIFEQGAPVREFDQTLYEMIGRSDPNWGRFPTGTFESVSGIQADQILAFWSREIGSGIDLVAGVVGPVEPEEVNSALGARTRRQTLPRNVSAPTLPEERLVVTRAVTNSWVAFVFPIDIGADLGQMEFLAHSLGEILNPDPPEAGVYWVEPRIESTPTGSALVIVGAVFPERADELENQIIAAKHLIATGGMDDLTVARWRRRFRTASMLSVATPEAGSLRMADALLTEAQFSTAPLLGKTTSVVAENIRSISLAQLQESARMLGEPRVLIFGPDLGTN